MENFIVNTISISLLCGIVFFIVAVIMYYFPPKKINRLYGYRTGTSMKSQDCWDFAQRFSAIKMIKGSAMLITVSLLGYFIPITYQAKTQIGLILLAVTIAYLIITTEKAIKKEFN